jgi:hypothetical protein
MNADTGGGDVGRALGDLAGLLPRAADAMADVRNRLAACWPTRPSMRALAADERALFESGMRLVEASRWKQGELYVAIEAANSTLDAHGHEPSEQPGLERWSLGRVDPAVAEDVRDRVQRRLDEITQMAPPDAWLPEWNVEDARAYIAAAKWRHARPPQPPHEYTVRDWRPERRNDFLAFAQFIQSRGVLKIWGDYVHAYMDVDGLEYWTMGSRVTETTVINRAPVGAPEAAQPLPAVPNARVLRATERALRYRRMDPGGGGVPTGILGERLRALRLS